MIKSEIARSTFHVRAQLIAGEERTENDPVIKLRESTDVGTFKELADLAVGGVIEGYFLDRDRETCQSLLSIARSLAKGKTPEELDIGSGAALREGNVLKLQVNVKVSNTFALAKHHTPER